MEAFLIVLETMEDLFSEKFESIVQANLYDRRGYNHGRGFTFKEASNIDL